MADERPNIVLVITDQQRYDTIRSLGFPYMDTPNLDRLVNEGVAFADCHVTAPSCAPARASLFTGQYPHTTGIYRNGDIWRHSWVERLSEAGYRTINVGKMHTSPYGTDLGFDERYVVENKDRSKPLEFFDEWDKALRVRGVEKPGRETYKDHPDYEERIGAFEWPADPDLHPDVFVGDLAEWWVTNEHTEALLEEPFFLEVGFPGPHPPYDPLPEYAKTYMDRDLPIPEITDEDIGAQPPPLQALRKEHGQKDHDATSHDLNPDSEQIHRQRAYYFGNVTMIDEQVGKLLDALDGRGLLENTVVVFMSDHGDALCAHGHSQKWTMYDIVTRVPLIVWAPDRFEGGRTVEGLCQLMDVGPTVLELAEAGVPDAMQADSLLPPLRGEPWEGREYVFAEQGRDGIFRESTLMTMIRSEDWKLVHFLDESFGQLFDLNADPEERKDLWDDPEAQNKKEELLTELREWRIRSQYSAREWAEDHR